jgi:hypothetical protein
MGYDESRWSSVRTLENRHGDIGAAGKENFSGGVERRGEP